MSQPYTLEQVKEWFGGLTVFDTKPIKRHLESLCKYGDNQVKTINNPNEIAWRQIFNECLGDVKKIHNDGDYKRYYRELFEERCGIPKDNLNDRLNTMIKKDFVILFANVMKDIFIEEEKQRQEKIQKRQEEIQQLQSYNKIQDDIDRKASITYKNASGSGARFVGGSKKKSRKRATTRNRRRSRRIATRKYKKYNKR